MLSVDIIFNAAARHIIKISFVTVAVIFLLNYFKNPLYKVLNYIYLYIPKEYIPIFAFIGKYKIDILLVMLLLLLSIIYTRNLSFEKKEPDDKVQLIVETVPV